VEAAGVWDLMQRLTGQLRVVGNGAVIGIDMAPAFLLADALGVNQFALAELFPIAEAVIIRKINETIKNGSDGPLKGDVLHG
jgi:hypothetical protein